MSAKIIAISQHKGGVGKTVTSLGISSCLARKGHKTLLVDLDPQNHSTLGIGIRLPNDAPTIRDLFTDRAIPVEQIIQSTHLDRLDLLPSSIRLEKTAQSLSTERMRHEILKQRLAPIYDQYEFVILDCPPSLGALTENAISAADLIVIPTQLEARAADSLVDLLEVISIFKGDKQNWGILLTRVDRRKKTTNPAIQAALSPWENRIFKTTIPQSEPLNQAQIAGTDIFNYSPASRGALAYEAFTQEILNHGQR